MELSRFHPAQPDDVISAVIAPSKHPRFQLHLQAKDNGLHIVLHEAAEKKLNSQIAKNVRISSTGKRYPKKPFYFDSGILSLVFYIYFLYHITRDVFQ